MRILIEVPIQSCNWRSFTTGRIHLVKRTENARRKKNHVSLVPCPAPSGRRIPCIAEYCSRASCDSYFLQCSFGKKTDRTAIGGPERVVSILGIGQTYYVQ